MTRRILLTLADDTTDTECGACQYVHDVTAWCVPFWDGASAGAGGLRDPRCIAAEAAAARMVEIAPEDAAACPVCHGTGIRQPDGSQFRYWYSACGCTGKAAR